MSDNSRFARIALGLVAPTLKAHGFRKNGARFNRLQRDGLVHIVQFWIATAWSSAEGKGWFEFAAFGPSMNWYPMEVGPWLSSDLGQQRD